MLQSLCLEDHIDTIGIDQSLSNWSYFEHKFLNNIKKIYQNAGKFDYQQNLKDIIGAAMVSTPEEITDISPTLRITQTTVKKTSARKSLCTSTNVFYVEKRTSKRRVGAVKSKQRASRVGNSL